MLVFDLYNPHAFLGLHTEKHGKVIRIFRPGVKKLAIELFGQKIEAFSESELFEFKVPEDTTFLDYKIYQIGREKTYDPYAFLPTFGEIDTHLFNKGVHYKLYEAMGGRLCEHQGCQGAKFALWAPNAKGVSLVGDFNQWDGRLHPMRSLGNSGVWELFVPGLKEGALYKFEIRTAQEEVILKTDPYAYFAEVRPKTASILFDVDNYLWQDQVWREKGPLLRKPMVIYEVHLGGWKKGLNYRELAHELAAYCIRKGFTHVELMPVSEHPLDESWGYQVTGFYAVTSRFGTPTDFQYFVDYLHQHAIGIIIDWVPAHFPVDSFALAKFDGTNLYEHADPRKGFHPHWNTNIFNYGRHEVSNFLIASALFWCDKMHIDGLRVDAVASMLYLDYGRQPGEWIPNERGGNENGEAIEFLKHMNSIVHQYFPATVVCAEESTSFPGITHPLAWGGLGFDLKWNMGWMNDTLRYFQREHLYRSFHQNDLTFGLLYAFTERFILVLSHDEVVHGKGSLIAKMPGDDWQKFANVRLLYSYMICHPGKKLLFMGGEIGQWEEWNCKEEIKWELLQYEKHEKLSRCVQELNHFYQKSPPLWERDFEESGFQWLDFQDSTNCVLSYLRKSEHEVVMCLHHFTPSYVQNYFVNIRNVKNIEEVFNTDGEQFGGSGKVNLSKEIVIKQEGVFIHLAPLSTMIFRISFHD